MIRAIIFDIGGVLVDHDNSKMLARLQTLLERPPSLAELTRLAFDHGVETGELPVQHVFDRLVQTYGSTASQQDWIDAWTCHFSGKPEMEDFVLNAVVPQLPCHICSNNNAVHWDHVRRTYPIFAPFQKVYLSQELGLAKPDRAIFDLMARELNGAQDILFVDDRADNVEAAKASGFLGHTFTRRDAFERHLQTLGL
ncbi:HAD family hydrolase [Methylovirgula sp. 4M-Z18]|uniref:HAD family hydrolase n=1 Tax=Methylovirgula sp. 4M-Z18 TaxID=2293567 RepID=UPI000E2F02B8|nr:HAD family phosphatase [Methylovirgula sp. 4M-Z18]RFB78938.1 HAD family phosphatase [Methylovirgula sp. 4M-Z18]